jgi:hypothetical protein
MCVGIVLHFEESNGTCLWFSYHFMHDYDHILLILFDNERVKLYFIVPLITIYLIINLVFLRTLKFS